MKYTIYTRAIDPEDTKIYQEEIDVDLLQFDPHTRFLICLKTANLTLPQGMTGQEPQKFGTVSHMFNVDYLVEVRLSSVMKELLN